MLLGMLTPEAGRMVVVCTGTGVTLINLDAKGEPVEEGHDRLPCAHLWCGSRRRAMLPATG
jgi:hypothetical protein